MTAAAQLITDNLDIWASAVKAKSAAGRGKSSKLELYGIKKLRELILELAVRGLLVPQDHSDEPASELFKKIAAEKARLAKDGKIKKQKALPPIDDKETPFELPGGWGWARLGEVGIVASSSRVHKKEWQASGVPFYRAREIVKLSQYGAVDNELFITEKLFEEHSKKGFVPEPGDMMLTGVGTIGAPYVVPSDAKFYFKDASVLIFKNYWDLYPQYLYYFMKSPFWNEAIHEGSMGTTVHTLTITRANIALIPVPPIEEQRRIVAKVNELMTLCDQLEQQQETSITAHQTLVQTLLDALTTASERDDFTAAWARIADHFDTLFTTEWSIDQLKQTILQLAVMGKLVPQDPNDVPASELLKKIAAEKARLLKDGKIKKQKELPPIEKKIFPFNPPAGWEWSRFEELADIQSGITKGRKFAGRETNTVPYLRVANVQRAFLDLEVIKEIEIHAEEQENVRVKNGDLLITEGGDWDKVGRTAIWRGELPFVTHQNHVFRARPFLDAQNEIWLEKYLNSPVAREYFADSSKQTTNLASINKTQLRGCLVAVPPRSEQHRIVTKVDELLVICDRLNARINGAQTAQTQLADAIGGQIVG